MLHFQLILVLGWGIGEGVGKSMQRKSVGTTEPCNGLVLLPPPTTPSPRLMGRVEKGHVVWDGSR
jgi:hypothetical protein